MYFIRKIFLAVLRLFGLKKKAPSKPIPTIPTIPDLVGKFKDKHFLTRRKYIHATHYSIK